MPVNAELTLTVYYYGGALLLGAAGQLIRALMGLVRADRAAPFRPLRLAVSVLLGAVGGLVAALVYDTDGVEPLTMSLVETFGDRNFILFTATAGYFGADFIESVMHARRPTVMTQDPPAPAVPAE